MIVTKKSWLRLLFAVSGSTFINIWPRVAFVFALSVLVELVSIFGLLTFSLTPVPFTVVGLALAIFLGFRNSAAYDRYWEGRKLWGALVNVARNFSMQTRIIGAQQHNIEVRQNLVRTIIAYVHALRHRLRHSSPEKELKQYLDGEAEVTSALAQDNVPVAVLDQTRRNLSMHGGEVKSRITI